jgi:hypothetical protein
MTCRTAPARALAATIFFGCWLPAGTARSEAPESGPSTGSALPPVSASTSSRTDKSGAGSASTATSRSATSASTSLNATDSDEFTPTELRTAVGFAALDRPTGIAEFGFGWLTLPGAAICVEPLGGCREGDTSFLLDAWQLYRANVRFAVGAGIMLGLIPTNNPPPPKGREREHSRQYFTVEGTVRYYPYVGQNVEWWVGVTGGLVVVSDRFVVESEGPDRALLGPRGVTIRTEGGSLGIAGGPVIALTQNWALGSTLRYGHWFLPGKPAFDPFGSPASLTGGNTVISLGISVAFRTAL